ncbi:Vps51/Vps67-domain-containing protein [Pseudomassariella vexata]|uniref:Vacuolar protein sorting-associated protein 51 homolog n=1 Tax=Pseudomassariella vexata TaxID=1141098 RepID=A0A1Y2DHZ0_9PEZI|nr:Vps51/Vps67-domain-containing protein [Pseudomassariella vexata]ORY58851.1 Vps51/Vps67-domain-containing protein [Pseudomassariella vexata]
MSTIASPRDALSRRIPSSQNITTPTSSARPSLDVPRSASGSPNPNVSGASQSVSKRNRAALREYYNLRKGANTANPPSVEVTDPPGEHHEASEVPPSEMDKEGFEPEAYVKKALAEKGMEELLRLYTRILGEIRALDAEKKALVYDNYSKLIAATETIRKMRANMDPLNPMASTLDPAIAQIYSQASAIREELRKSVPEPNESSKGADEAKQRRLRTKQLAIKVLETPDRIRALVSEGRLEDAKQAWKTPRKLLEMWKEQGVGGGDVEACIEDGDAAVRGDPSQSDWRAAKDDED